MKGQLHDVLNEVKSVDNEINKLLVPILQDTIRDGNKYNKRMFIMNMCLICAILITTLFTAFLLYKQNTKYQEFLSQFDYGYEEIYQDLDTHDGGDITNSSIINN